MSSSNIKTANKYIAELQSKMSDYKRFSKEKLQPFFKKNNRERKPPKEFVDSSFLYIRSYDGDIGVRPFSGITFWHSPDVAVAPINDLTAYTKLLDAGKTYHFSCNVRNRGDLIVPSANVEFYLCNPTLGFDTRFATKLGVTAGWVNPYATVKVGVNYTIPADLSGHKCLFARTFSFSPVDLPIDDYQLSPPLDRHVAQLNLNIVAQSSSFMFNLVHLPNAMDRIELIPMNAEEVFSLRHPFLADLKPRRSGTARFMERMKVIMKDQGESGSRVRLIKRGRSVYFHSYNDRAISLQQQKVIVNNLHRVLRIKSDNAVHHREFREVFQAFRKMNRRVEQMEFELQIPDMRLAPGEASALKIVATNRVTGEMKGGITLIITG
jgi:hypothetical protein